jgi:hypothetical protein
VATELELRRHLGRLSAILWNYGATFPVPMLDPYDGGAMGFRFRALLPSPDASNPTEIKLVEVWAPAGRDGLRLVEYAYDFIDRSLDRRRAFHRHGEKELLRAFAVAVHEHCEEVLDHPTCGHYYGLPVDAYTAIRRFTVIWGQPDALGCDRLRCIG